VELRCKGVVCLLTTCKYNHYNLFEEGRSNLSHVLKVTFTRLIGSIDILNHMGGKADVAAISSKEQLELDDILAILETGQMLGFIQAKSGDVSITERGYSILSA
jgi:hypothetical protein